VHGLNPTPPFLLSSALQANYAKHQMRRRWVCGLLAVDIEIDAYENLASIFMLATLNPFLPYLSSQ
jgi:hypothetical protein